jgi:hypothetical protein
MVTVDTNIIVRLLTQDDQLQRIKTLEDSDKKKSISILLETASSEPNFRTRLDNEARELTEIGNKFMIRHTETTTTPIDSSAHVDYLFHRMFALIYLLLESHRKKSETVRKQDSELKKSVEEKIPF